MTFFRRALFFVQKTALRHTRTHRDSSRQNQRESRATLDIRDDDLNDSATPF